MINDVKSGLPLHSQVRRQVPSPDVNLGRIRADLSLRGISSGKRWDMSPVGVPPLGGFGAQVGRINAELQR